MRGKQEPQPPKDSLTSRYTRRVNRTQQKLKDAAAHPLLLMDIPDDDDSATSDYVCSVGTQTEMIGDFNDSMTSELQNLRTENIQLHSCVENLSPSYDQSAFEGKDEKVLFFTGLPTYQILLALFTYLSPHLPVKKSLNAFKVLMLTLMRLRLNVSTTFLSYAFNVSIATASRVFTDVIDVMFIRMKPLVI